MIDNFDPFDDESPGIAPPGDVITYDPFDDDDGASACACAPGIDFSYYDSEDFILCDTDARTPFATIVESTFTECPTLSRRSQVAEYLYNECPALAGADVDNLTPAVLSEIKTISDKAARLSYQEYNQDQKEARAARRVARDDFREEMLGTGRDIIDMAHESGQALHEWDAKARAQGLGNDWSSDKNKIARQARGISKAGAGGFISRGQFAAVAVPPARDDVASVADVPPVKKACPPPAKLTPKSTFKFAKLNTSPPSNPARAIPDNPVVLDMQSPREKRPAYSTPPPAPEVSNMAAMWDQWQAARGEVKYLPGHKKVELPAYLR